MATMSISELARAGGVGVETVRFYQRKGLLDDPKPARGGVAGRRHYGGGDLSRLRFVRSAQKAGFTLEEIARLIALDRDDDRPTAQAMARERIAALDAKIAELSEARAALTRLAAACRHDSAGPCPILTAFDA
jgi:MerR family transcriptional regulator, mercuric resistance operon regulatory protein